MTLRIVILALLAVLTQSQTARADKPRLILHTRGPAGQLYDVGFSYDSQRIFAGGLDKTVHVWSLDGNGVADRATLSRTIRWEIARGYRGVINALAVSPNDQWIAIAGTSTRDPSGIIVLADAKTGEIVRSLPKMPAPGQIVHFEDHETHKMTVIHLAWSPGGEKLVSVDQQGAVFVWSAPDWKPLQLHPRLKDEPAEFHRPAIFLNDRVVAAAQREEPRSTVWRIVLYDLHTGKPYYTMPIRHGDRIAAMSMSPDSTRWVSCSESGTIFLWNGFKTKPIARLPSEPEPRDLAFGPGGLLAVSHKFNEKKRHSALELWDTDKGVLIDSVFVSRQHDNRVCAISRDGTRLVTVNEDRDSLQVYRLRDANGQRIDRPLSQGKPLELRGRGRAGWHVAFEDKAGSHLFGFGRSRILHESPEKAYNNYGQVEQTFDPTDSNYSPFTPKETRWRKPTNNSGGWTLQASFDTTSEIPLTHSSGIRSTLKWNKDKQGRPSCFCWIPGPDGSPYAVAIGSDTSFGVYVYSLPTGNEQPELLRYFRDHQGDVTSLSVSSDGRYLASASKDQTIKIWSLAGLRDRPQTFSKSRGWGAEFAVQGNRFVVTKITPGGIAERRNLQVDDVVTRLWYDLSATPKNSTDAAEMKSVAEESWLYLAFAIEYERNGRPQPAFQIVPAWEPVMTFFADERGEWALWTPEGYYDSSVAEGDDLFGWLINRGAGEPPRILKATHLQREFERPDLIRQLLKTGNIRAAFQALRESVPNDLSIRVANVAQQIPEVRIVEPRLADRFLSTQTCDVIAEVRYPPQAKPNQFRVTGFVNGRPLGPAEPSQDANRHRFTWKGIQPPDSFSRFTVKVEPTSPELLGRLNFNSDSVSVAAQVTPQKYKLYLLAIAVNDYQQSQNGPLIFRKLNFSIGDAQEMVKTMSQTDRAIYELGHAPWTLYDRDVTRQNFDHTVNEIRQTLADAGPNDLLVIFVSGHGHADKADYYFIPHRLQTTDTDTLAQQAISWTQLRRLADLRCRKMVLLDTCQAGNVLLEEKKDHTRQLKAAIRPLKRAEFLVFAATSTNQSAFAGPPYGGHGAFTFCLLQGLRGRAKPLMQDKVVALPELVEFTTSEVRRRTGDEQVPTYTPGPLLELLDSLYLVRE